MATQDVLPDNLWPDYQTLSQYKDQPPLGVLVEQAKFFGQRTKNLLEAVVKSSVPEDQTGKVFHSFIVRAPFLHNVQVKLFFVGHNITLYPVDVSLRDNTLYRTCYSSEQLKSTLHDLFREEDILQQVGNLLAQTNTPVSLDASDEDD